MFINTQKQWETACRFSGNFTLFYALPNDCRSLTAPYWEILDTYGENTYSLHTCDIEPHNIGIFGPRWLPMIPMNLYGFQYRRFIKKFLVIMSWRICQILGFKFWNFIGLNNFWRATLKWNHFHQIHRMEWTSSALVFVRILNVAKHIQISIRAFS